MPHAKPTVWIPEGLWIHAISTDDPDAVVRVISVLPDPNLAVGVLELTKSACSDVLHRAEAAIAHWFAEAHVGPGRRGR